MNLPINLNNKRVLFVGIGGGFDIYGAVPLLAAPRHLALANLSLEHKEFIVCTDGDSPEGRLASYLDLPVYAIPKAGVRAVRQHLLNIIKQEKVDTIVCVDGGVDSLMTGEEEGAGTILEDTVTMTAISTLEATKYLVAVGFGTEMEEDVSHYHALENMAKLVDAFLGSCSLTKGVEFDYYKAACEHGWKDRRKSHIHTKVISAVEGKFGTENAYAGIDARVSGAKEVNFITPLMGVYWFFELDKVVNRNRLSKLLETSNTWTDVILIHRNVTIKKKPRVRLPL